MPAHALLGTPVFEFREGSGASRAAAIAAMGAWAEGGGLYSAYGLSGATHLVYESRWKWRIDPAHTGSYYRVTWYDGAFPTVGSPYIYSGPVEWVWTGPGDPDFPEGGTWDSGWYSCEIPSFYGDMNVTNGRFYSYAASSVGVKGTAIGGTMEI